MIIKDHSDAEVRFLQVQLGGDRNFSYLFGERESGRGVAVDPGFAPGRLLAIAKENQVAIDYILITHGHGDHVGGLAQLQAATAATAYAGPDDQVPGCEPIQDGQRLALGKMVVEALHTPGHSPGHVCYLFAGRLITGDLLFCGKVGGTGMFFPGSSAAAEWDSLHRLLRLPDATQVFPGHDYYGGKGTMLHSTIGFERTNNPFLLCQDFAAFCALKENWAAYKEEHGIR
jgi:glyoxylase-like metal-dependent hydrolase (beta-lactamase superfamily II)